MFRRFLILLLVISCFLPLFSCGSGGEEPTINIGMVEPLDLAKVVIDPETGQKVVNDQILITFKEGVSEEEAEVKIESINGEIVGYIEGMNDYQIKIKGGISLEQLKDLVEQLNNDPDVEIAVLNPIEEINAVPNDPDWGDEWSEENPSGKNWGLEAIYAPSAWDYNNIMSSVKIGVVDFGFGFNHEDLDIPAGNASGVYNRPYALESDSDEYIERNNHGTHVTGIVGALSDNQIGITGLVWNKDLYLYRTDGQLFNTKFGIVWLLAHGARVVNLSIGQTLDHEPTDNGTEEIDTFDERIFIEKPRKYWSAFIKNIVRIKGYDFLIVRAAGNEGRNAKWSGNFCSISDNELRKRIIVVGAIETNWWSWFTGPSYSLAQSSPSPINPLKVWTNYGPKVDVVAPGEDIYSTICYEPYYGEKNGTSMAAPFITGTAGLVWGVNPNLTAEQVKNIIVGTADRPIYYGGLCYWILNAKAAVERARSGWATEPIEHPQMGILIGKTQDATTTIPIEDTGLVAKRDNSYYASANSQFDGSYELALEIGTYLITIGKEGYISKEMTVTVTKSDIFTQDVLLWPESYKPETALNRWPMFRHDPQHTSRSQFSGPSTSNLLWSMTVATYDLYSPPVAGRDGTIYITENNYSYGEDTLSAYNPDGSLKWKFNPKDISLLEYYFIDFRFPPVIGSDGTIYIMGINVNEPGSEFFALDPNGSLKWAAKKGACDAYLAIDSNDMIYVGHKNGVDVFYPNGNLKWSYNCDGGQVEHSPAVGFDGTVYVAAASHLFAIDSAGTAKWNIDFGNESIFSKPAIGPEGTIYTGTSNKIYAINPNGSIKWEYAAYYSYNSLAIGSDGTIYIVVYEYLHAISPTGDLKRKIDLPIYHTFYDCTLCIDKDGVVYAATQDTLLAINPDGSLKWSYNDDYSHFRSPVIGNEGRLYVGCHLDKIYAFGN